MKKFILSMTMLVLVLCLKTNISNAAEISAMERLDYWDVSKEYTITNQDATYHAYLSKDKKESWIFKADVAKDKKNVKVVIPDKIENAPVVIVGATSGYDEILAKQNLGSVGIQGPDGSYYLDAEVTLWGDLLEPWHCPGPYIKNIKSITMPDTVRYLGAAAFAYTTSVETIHLSNQLVSLRNYTFLECKNLKKIDILNNMPKNNEHWEYEEVIQYTKKHPEALEEYHKRIPKYYSRAHGIMSNEELDKAIYGCEIQQVA